MFTRIEAISADHFTVACSITDRMVPYGQAQRVLKVKLTLEDIEREANVTKISCPNIQQSKTSIIKWKVC